MAILSQQPTLIICPTLLIIISLAMLSLQPAATTTYDDQPSSVYEALQQYDFPTGLLPKGATGYDLNATTGEFCARLNRTCSFKLENKYELKYEPTIKGVISKGRLRKLSGVSVKVMFMWLNISEVKRSGDDLEFNVGIASAEFPVSNFDERPQCGCGLDCGGDGKVEYN